MFKKFLILILLFFIFAIQKSYSSENIFTPLLVRDTVMSETSRPKQIALIPPPVLIDVISTKGDWVLIKWYSDLDKKYKYGYVSDLSYLSATVQISGETAMEKLDYKRTEIAKIANFLEEENQKAPLNKDYRLIMTKTTNVLDKLFIIHDFLAMFDELPKIEINNLKDLIALSYHARAGCNIYLDEKVDAEKDLYEAGKYAVFAKTKALINNTIKIFKQAKI